MERKKSVDTLNEEIKNLDESFKELMDVVKPFIKRSEFIFESANEKWEIDTLLNNQSNIYPLY